MPSRAALLLVLTRSAARARAELASPAGGAGAPLPRALARCTPGRGWDGYVCFSCSPGTYSSTGADLYPVDE